jgi:hypothetical protein
VADPVGKPLRCAIYTRKSTEEGLDQAFNSLHAQREAGEAFVASQQTRGWMVVPERYDDGGFAGAHMERPALQRLLQDVDRGAIDCVLVYKVDRLSRSLLDFSRLMERFDRQGVSFVSVTQDFKYHHVHGEPHLGSRACYLPTPQPARQRVHTISCPTIDSDCVTAEYVHRISAGRNPMNKSRMKKNAWSHVRLRPIAKRFYGAVGPQLPPVDDDWLIQGVEDAGVRISNNHTGHGTLFAWDQIHHYADPDRGGRNGFLILNTQVNIGGNSLWCEPTFRPGAALPDSFGDVRGWKRENDPLCLCLGAGLLIANT